MDNTDCRALVPYVPIRHESGFFEKLYFSRQWTYFFMCPLLLAFCVCGGYYFAFWFSDGRHISFADNVLELSYIGVPAAVMLFFVIMLAYTVFAQAGSIILVTVLPFSVGFDAARAYFAVGFSREFVLFTAEKALFLFCVLLYACELVRRIDVTKQGIKYVLAAKNNIPLIFKTIVFAVAFVVNSIHFQFSS